ncbi:MAG: carbohydrate kinase [Planctomycetes bacterium]|nr:carbohydrate kinase [Planctomycetota bacterium]
MSQKTERMAAPLAMGTGLIALDVVVTDDRIAEAQHCTGGTCGNVLLALRYLGFDVAPVSRLQNDSAARLIRTEFRKLGVDTRFVSFEEDGNTPIIVQTIRSNPGGAPTHSFSWRCPTCDKRFPGYKPALATTAESIAEKMPSPQVFFFDRVNRGSLVLAKRAAELGALVMFEPSSVGDQSHFQEAWALAHVVKYSHERLADLPDTLEFGPNLLLQIETLGAEGLRYRAKFGKRATSSWRTLDALKAHVLVDSAGAGDWCAAGLLDRLGRDGAEGLRAISPTDLENGLRYGQALAAWNCGYAGARGGMSHVSVEECLEQVESMLAGRQSDSSSAPKTKKPTRSGSWCPVCSDDSTAEELDQKSKRTTA